MKHEVREYRLETNDNLVSMPEKAKILRVEMRNVPDGDPYGVICIWALVNKTAPEHKRRFRIFETEEDLPNLFCFKHVGTVIHNQLVVRHVFEVTP